MTCGGAIPLLSAVLLFGASFSGKVVGISDGDTIRVLHNGIEDRVRLLGVDCPETRQPWSTRAKQYTSTLAFGKIVKVDVKQIDRYSRSLGVVTLPDGRILNRELVRAGLAWWYREYSRNDLVLAMLEAEARSTKRGLWADPNPTPPWEFRMLRRTSRSRGVPIRIWR